MTWNVPSTEEQWSECLSAYLDEEMSEEDRTALESYLSTDPERLAQLVAYRQTSTILQGWTVEAPQPCKALIRQLKHAQSQERKFFWHRFLSPNMHWFQFSMGVVTGVFAWMFVQNALVLIAPTGGIPISKPADSQSVLNVFISKNQAENLIEEVTASGLTTQMKSQLRNNQWNEAADTYQSLLQHYSQTKAFLEIKNVPAVQMFLKKFLDNKLTQKGSIES